MKVLLLLLSGFKYLKFGKLLATGGSMLLSVAAYAWVFGWRYAAGFVLLLLVHELGHYVRASAAWKWARPCSFLSWAPGSS